MSRSAAARADAASFNPRVMLVVTAVGILAFVAMLALGAYAPDLRSGRNGGTHALSNSATGFSGLVRLAEQTGRNPLIVRSDPDLESEDLVVITPDHGWVDLGDILELRGPRTTLLVLPKWATSPDERNSGWVTVAELLPADDPERTLAPANPLKISRMRGKGALSLSESGPPGSFTFLAPAVLQTMRGKGIEPVIIDGDGRIVLGKVAGSQLYVLADPDLINNHGMGDQRQARAALELLDYLNSTGAESVLFDVTSNGLGQSRSPLRLAFDVPFLAVTITMFVALLLAAWQATIRFGPIRHQERAIAFGKVALVTNSAALIRRAGRQARLGRRYVEAIRERAAGLIGVPAAVDADALDSRLEAANPNRSFALAAAEATDAQTPGELLRATQSLNRWLQEIRK